MTFGDFNQSAIFASNDSKMPPVVPEIKDYDAIYKFDWSRQQELRLFLQHHHHSI
jgi:hypothetical protein